MSLLKAIRPSGSTLAWCPLKQYRNLIVTGTREGMTSGFDDSGGALEIYDLDFSQSSETPVLYGRVKTPHRFTCIQWSVLGSSDGSHPFGLIAAGLADGTVEIYDASVIANAQGQTLSIEQCRLANVKQHTGVVNALSFNPHASMKKILASGGGDGKLFLMDLSNPREPRVFKCPGSDVQNGEVKALAWNSQVEYIFAAAYGDGTCNIFDLKSKKLWAQLKDNANKQPITGVQWNPTQGLHIMLASGDDHNPKLKLFDLQMSTSMPFCEFIGHTKGVLSLAWSPHNASMVMSSAKDGRTILWDVKTQQIVFDLSNNANNSDLNNAQFQQQQHQQSAADLFGGGTPSNQSQLSSSLASGNIELLWSPCQPAILAAASFNRAQGVQIFSLIAPPGNTAPAWLGRRCGAMFGFDGRLVQFREDSVSQQTTQKNQQFQQVRRIVDLQDTTNSPGTDGSLLASVGTFFSQAQDALSLSQAKVQYDRALQKTSSADMWDYLEILFAPEDTRKIVLQKLGFNRNSIAQQVCFLFFYI